MEDAVWACPKGDQAPLQRLHHVCWCTPKVETALSQLDCAELLQALQLCVATKDAHGIVGLVADAPSKGWMGAAGWLLLAVELMEGSYSSLPGGPPAAS